MAANDRVFSRRTALGGVGLAAVGVLAGPSILGASSAWASPPQAGITFEQWKRDRGAHYYVAHRGSGDVYPEHSLEAYRAAVEWGAQCLEISVGMTSDGVLICMHDPTYDRTTNATGRLIDLPSSALRDIEIIQPQLGEGWNARTVRVPLLRDVLAELGGRVVLAIEAKNSQAYPRMVKLLDDFGLTDSVIIKLHHGSTRVRQAQRAGYPVFGYFGSARETDLAGIASLARRLDPARDCLVVPGFANGATSYVPDSLIRAAVDTGVSVWVHPLHRRSDAAHFFSLGVEGAICSSFGYIAGSSASSTTDSWAGQMVAPGEMSRDPSSEAYAPDFTPRGELVLAKQGAQHVVTMGQLELGSRAQDSYTIELDASWVVPPVDPTDALTVAFARADDSYYEHRQGRGDGYHLILRANGDLGLYRHRDGVVNGQQLASASSAVSMVAGEWTQLRIEVTPTDVSVSSPLTGTVLRVPDAEVRGAYFHLGRTSVDGVGAFSNLTIS